VTRDPRLVVDWPSVTSPGRLVGTHGVMACARGASCGAADGADWRVGALWFGDGLYWWPSASTASRATAKSASSDDLWVFGLEDRFFPLAPAADADGGEDSTPVGGTPTPTVDETDVDIDVDGLTEGFLQFLERRLQVAETPAAPAAPTPVAPIRQRRLQRSSSLQRPAPLQRSASLQPLTSSAKEPASLPTGNDAGPGGEASRRLGRRSADWMKTQVRGWTSVTAGIRKALRKVCRHSVAVMPQPLPQRSFLRF